MRWFGRRLLNYSNTLRPARTLQLPGQSGHKIQVDVYEPTAGNSSTVAKSGAEAPVVINLSGAAFCLDTLGSDATFCQKVADEVGCVVLDIDYAKAPERPWPAATEDVVGLVRWLKAEGAAQNDWDANRISLSGFSSGGCIALLAAIQLDGHIKACICFYPSWVYLFSMTCLHPSLTVRFRTARTDLSTPPDKKPQVKSGKGANGTALPPWFRRFFYNMYLPQPGLDWSDPRISPRFAGVEEFPPTTIITCEKDALAQEARQVVDKLRQAQRDVVHWEVPGQGHGWDKVCPPRINWQILAKSDELICHVQHPGAIQIDETYGLAVKRIKEAFDTTRLSITEQ